MSEAKPNSVKPQSLTLGATEHRGDAPRPLDADERARIAAEKNAKLKSAIHDAKSLEDKIIAAIKTVHDPEIPVNIYELGLIYDIAMEPDPESAIGEKKVAVTMTLTSANCPAAQEIPVDVKKAVERIAEVSGATVEVVFDPPWEKEMMSEEAQVELGLF